MWEQGAAPARIQLYGVLLEAILPPVPGRRPNFTSSCRNTWVRAHLPWPSGSPRYGSCLENKASLTEETSLRRSGVEVEEPARNFSSSAPRSPARSFSRTSSLLMPRIYPVAVIGPTSLDTLPNTLPLAFCGGEGGSLPHLRRVDDTSFGSWVRAGALGGTLQDLPPPAFVW